MLWSGNRTHGIEKKKLNRRNRQSENSTGWRHPGRNKYDFEFRRPTNRRRKMCGSLSDKSAKTRGKIESYRNFEFLKFSNNNYDTRNNLEPVT